MSFNRKHAVMIGSGVCVLAVAVPIAVQAAGEGSIARYDMRAGTVSGIGGLGGGMGSAMSMMFGGRGGNRLGR